MAHRGLWPRRRPLSRRTAGGRDTGWFRPGVEQLETRTVPSFIAGINSPAGADPSPGVAADFNNDGKMDLAFATKQGTVELLGNGDGTFHAFIPLNDFATGDLVALDLNGDGNVDIAAATGGGLGVGILLGNGDGTFQPIVEHSTNSFAYLLRAADMNHDGRIDLVAGTQTGVAILKGNGDGTFQPADSFPIFLGPGAMVVGDFDNDGQPDVLVRSGDLLYLLKGNGDGTLQPKVNIPYQLQLLSGLGMGDFNNDRNLDFAIVTQSNEAYMFMGQGDGTFRQSTIIHDLNGTGVGGAFFADVNSDGKLDLITTNEGSYSISVLFGNGDSTFQPPVSYQTDYGPGSVVVSDLNNDGIPDIAAGNDNSHFGGGSMTTVFLGVGAGIFQGATSYVAGPNFPNETLMGDVNGDGNLDVLVTEGKGLQVLLGNGDSTFQPPITYDVGKSVSAMRIADFNDDGHLDVVMTSWVGNGVYVLLNKGDGSFDSPIVLTAGNSPKGVAVADFNNDGEPDLAVTNQGDNTVSILFGNGDGHFLLHNNIQEVNGPDNLAAADFNDDGKPDLAVCNDYSQDITILIGDGQGGFTQTQNLGGTGAVWRLVTADLDKDGNPDLVYGYSNLHILHGNGNGTFQMDGSGISTGDEAIAVADLNGDGNLDVVSTGRPAVWVNLGNGDGTLQAPTRYSTGPDADDIPGGVSVGDLNNDGVPDIVVGNAGTMTITVLRDEANGLRLTLNGSLTVSPGAPRIITVTAHDAYGRRLLNYRGTVRFDSTDAAASLPADYTFTSDDQGIHAFPITFRTLGDQDVTATDSSNQMSGILQVVHVTNTIDHFQVNGASTSGAGTAVHITVIAVDGLNQTVPSYRGTVHVTSTDSRATLPADYTFTAGDRGIHVFDVNLESAGDQSLVVADTSDGSKSGTASIIVNPAAVSKFLVTGYPMSLTAGVTGTFMVSAEDSFGNVNSSYAGTVQVATSDPQVTPPPNATLTNGVGSFSLALKTAGTQSITATDTADPTITGSQSNIPVSPAVASRLVLSGYPNPAAAGSTATFQVTAQDPFGNTATGYTSVLHFTSSDSQATLPPDTTLTAGTGVFAATLRTLGTESITATDTSNATLTASQTGITVNPGFASRFVISGFPTPVTAGTVGNFTVTAQDIFGNTATGYTSTVHFSSTDGIAGLPADATLVAGVRSFNATLKTAGLQQITATDTANHAITGSQVGIVVNASAASKFGLGFPSGAITAGLPVAVTVVAQDPFGNLAADYGGTVHFSSSDVTAVLPPDSSLTNGAAILSVTFKKAGVQSLSAMDTANSALSGTKTGILVNAAAASQLLLAGLPTALTAGVATSFTITAQDAFGNTATGYGGTLHFGSSDPQAVLPADSGLTNGTGSFSVTLKTSGTRSLTITDTASSSLTIGQTGISVSPAAMSQFAITGIPSQAIAGTAFSITVTADDRFGNFVSGYGGTIHFVSDDPRAVLPVDGPLAGGSGTFPVTFKTVGSHSLTISDSGNASISTTQSGIAVGAGAATTLAMTGLPTALMPGVAGSFVLAAHDDFGNVATAYRGTIHFSSSDAHATLPGDYTFTAGDAGIRRFAANFVTAGSQSVAATDTTNASQTASLGTLVDGTAPTSTIGLIPAFAGDNLTLTWSGSDNPSGSGIADFDILVSDNGGAFVSLLTGTSLTTTVFHGQGGHNYAFDSIAIDQAGNRQPMPGTPQASTTIDLLPPVGGMLSLAAFNPNDFTIAWSGSDSSGIASFDILVSDNGGAFAPLLTGTTQTSATFHAQTDHIYGFVSVATDNAGNRQSVPTTAQASTQIALPPPISLPAVAAQITHSLDHFRSFVTSAYQTYLGHAPDQAGLNAWVAAMQGGLSDERLEANFIGSAEFINANGGLGAGWVTAMYQDLLGRSPSQAEISSWVVAIQHGVSPANIALGFAASAERESNRVGGDYKTFLGRSPDQSEVTSWVNAFGHGLTNENLVAGFLGSAEYYNSPAKGQGNSLDWITAATQDELGRAPSSSEISSCQTALLPSRLQQVSTAITHSAEHFRDFVTHAYQTYLGHAPDQTGLNSWVQAMQNGVTDEQVEANFIGSAEFINANGGLGAGWVRAMYQDLLGRAPSQTEIDGWVSAINHGSSPATVALGFAASAEREGHRVQDDYFAFLGRSASQSEVNSWVNAFSHGLTNENLSSGFIGSQEYYTASSKGKNNKVDWLSAAVQDVLGRTVSEDEFNTWGIDLM